MRIEFHSVTVPHRKLLLGIPAVRLPRRRIPCPELIGVEQVELPCQIAGLQHAEGSNEVSIDIVGMILIFRERTVSEDVPDAYLPELLCENLQVVDQAQAPRRIP